MIAPHIRRRISERVLDDMETFLNGLEQSVSPQCSREVIVFAARAMGLMDDAQADNNAGGG